MRKAVQKAIGVTFCVTVATGIPGFFYGRFVLTKTGVDAWAPDNLVDKNAFITVSSIHNFSDLGGLLGLVAGIYYLVQLNKLQRRQAIETSSPMHIRCADDSARGRDAPEKKVQN